MSAICQNFVQNAWKKELCSNCFKSKDEHNAKIKKNLSPPEKTVKSIVKKTKTNSKSNVRFPPNLTEVIGYGGEEWAEGEDFNLSEDTSEEEVDVSDADEEKELKRLTKANTDFNTVNANLLGDGGETKRSFTQLMLGKPQLDSAGKKQTLLVSVTPFGQDAPNSPTKRTSKSISHIPIAKINKEVGETKGAVVLTSYSNKTDPDEEKSLLEEISETLEKGTNAIQIMSRKKTQKDIVLTLIKTETTDNESNKMGENDSKLNKSNIPERKNGLSRSPAIKRDQEKPAVYQTSVAKIELLNTKNSRFSGKENLVETKEDSEENKIVTKNPVVECKNENVNLVQEVSNPIKEVEPEFEKTAEKLCGLPPLVPKFLVPESREQAGEPDGRADSDESTEPPALPLTPPPTIEARTFLQTSPTYDKPKIPLKPATVLIRKPNHGEIQPQTILSTFAKLDEESKSLKQDDSKTNKRKAPMPPSPEIISRNSPEERRERATSCSPKFTNDPTSRGEAVILSVPEPAPRRSLSLSTDSLASNLEEKKKEKTKVKFSLKKFLRMSSSKDNQKLHEEIKGKSEIKDFQAKPRLVIVHPLELNGAKVVSKSMIENDHVDYMFSRNEYNDHHIYDRPVKPPPPPRNLDDSHQVAKPNLPPPKSVEILNKHKQFNNTNLNQKREDTVYANIGEVRSAIIPNKPQRTASMREREAQENHKTISDNYEPVTVQSKNENVYDYINGARSSSPESDSNPGKESPKIKILRTRNGNIRQGRSESSIDITGDYYKYQNIPRSASLTYCGSETESEIYSPYSFYGSESEVAEDDRDWTIHGARTYKLRSRKGRSIVHKNLEDNYGAVVIANHEALAQVLENIQQGPTIQPALRGLKTTTNLRWTDFTITDSASSLKVGPRIFHEALWNSQHVTLVISIGSMPSSSLNLGTFNLMPITEFSDLLPNKYFMNDFDENTKQASIAILPFMQTHTIQTYSEFLKSKPYNTQEEMWKDGSFILLQLVNALKTLQAQGIEELPLSLTSFVVCKDMERETYHRLCVLQGLGEEISRKKDEDKFGSLCVCASSALMQLLPTAKLTPLIRSLLNTERAVSLTQVKSVLEFSLWGPSDVTLGNSIKERELALQRWLDLQRATVLHGLVCTRIQLTVYEEYHLLFLVRSNAKMMCDASLLLESSNATK